ncbi:hypothetical protein G5B38_04235 [Pseudohalocynthiibacter aestuariivivens]|nr:hypothetical protein [Pseudohalocynthiibacter aestuariivivens]QIE44798.1 hypothetical protein G5B38_04235 [Pseudohalocynthiibacter aestuariivivens]
MKILGIFKASPGIFSALCIKRTNNLAESCGHVKHNGTMQDKTINNALLELRKQMIRANENNMGVDFVEALLQMRCVHMPAVLPAKRKDAARRGHMSVMILDALSSGPKPLRAIAAHVALRRPEIDDRAAYTRTTQALDKLKRRGHVVQDFGPDGCLWKLF